jgi:ParB-like chromosome segregation protein Spo0J
MATTKQSSRIPSGTALTLTGLHGRAERLDIRGLRFDSNVRFVQPTLLTPNPLNTTLFDDEPEDALQALMEDIREHGIHDALLVKADNTLLTGHNRLRAALRLGLPVVPVRYLLDALADAHAEMRFMVADNLLRRQLSTEQKIKLYRYLYGENFLQQMATHGGKRKGISAMEGQVEALNLNGETAQGQKKESNNGTVTVLAETPLTAERIARETGQKTSAVQRQLYDWKKKEAQRTPSISNGTTSASHQQNEREANRLITSSLEEIERHLTRTDVSEEWRTKVQQRLERWMRRLPSPTP